MKKFKVKAMSVKAMADIRGGGDITHDTTILLSRKTRQKALSLAEDKATEIVGTVTIDRER